MDNVIPPIPTEDNGAFMGGPAPTGPGAPTPTPAPTTPDTTNAPVKSGGGIPRKAIVTIFGVLLLIAGVGAGIILVQQQQVLKQKAAPVASCTGTITCLSNAAGGGQITIDCTRAGTDQNACNQLNQYPSGYTCNALCSFGAGLSTCGSGLSCSGSSISGASQCLDSNGSTVYCCPSGQTNQNGTCSGSTTSTSGGGTYCSGNCCNLGANPSNYLVKQCSCSSHTAAPCNDNCTYGGSACVTPSCGTVQLDIVNQAHQEASQTDGSTQVLIHAATDCTSGTGAGTTGGSNCDGTCSNYCAGSQQCTSQGGHDVGRGCTGGVSSCQTGTIHCFIPAACQNFGGGAPAPTPTPLGARCGDTCTSDSQCQNPSPAGATVKCIGGVCQNTACIGKTNPGRNCDCSSLNACGQGCSAVVGLCQTGSVCRYVVGPACTDNPNGAVPTNTFCVPTTLPAGWSTRNCVSRDQGNSYVTDANGQNPTQAEILAACAPPATASCSSVTAYDTNWNALSISQLSSLSVGSVVRFAVSGTATSGNFDKARFTVNGALGPEVTTQNPKQAGQFYYDYTIPTGVTSFTVAGEVHHQQLNNWF